MSEQEIRLIALPEVVSIAGISKSEIFRRIKLGTFPEPARIGGRRCTRWEASEIQAWIRERLAERNLATIKPPQQEPKAPSISPAAVAQLLAFAEEFIKRYMNHEVTNTSYPCALDVTAHLYALADAAVRKARSKS